MHKNIIDYIVKNYNNLISQEDKRILETKKKIDSWNVVTKKFDAELKMNLLDKFDLVEKDIIEFETFDNDNFLEQVVNKILSDPQKEKLIYFNICPFCGNLARTIRAKQCRNGHRW